MILDIVWNVDPVLLDLGPVKVRFYSLMFALGFFLSVPSFRKILAQENYPEEWTGKLLIYIVLGTLFGARLGHVIFYDPQMFSNDFINVFLPISFKGGFHVTGYSGLASHGGSLGVAVAVILFSKRVTHLPVMFLLDRLIPYFAFTAGLIRLGNLFNSEIYGFVTDVPWGFVFVRKGEELAKHPTQLYEAIPYFLIAALTFYLFRKTEIRKKRGLLFSIGITAIFVVRFFVEFLKELQVSWEEDMVNAIGLNQGQVLSIPFIVVGSILIIWYANKKPVEM